jgi:hypothetical protein
MAGYLKRLAKRQTVTTWFKDRRRTPQFLTKTRSSFYLPNGKIK